MMQRILTAAMMALLVCGVTTAAELHVPAQYGTIQAAVDAASGGDVILVAPGTYTGTGDEVVNTLGKAITIKASGTPEETILDGEGARGVVQCAGGEGPDTIIEGFTITGGSADRGGGIYCNYNSSPTITGCTISNNTAGDDGGGIFGSSNSSPTISGCTISGNTVHCYATHVGVLVMGQEGAHLKTRAHTRTAHSGGPCNQGRSFRPAPSGA